MWYVVSSFKSNMRGDAMDSWEDDFREPSEGERAARRVLSVAIAFVNADHPLSTTEIRRDLYPDLGDVAFRKSFARDRERLAEAGLVLRRAGKRGDELTWETDEESSFARENLLTQDDALTLDFLLLPLASDPNFPYSRDLRMALSKIDRSFDGSSTVAIPTEVRRRNKLLSLVEECLAGRWMVRITYERADGTTTTRVVAPYGLFVLNESNYMVGARYDDGELANPHTYNLGRLKRASALKRLTYAIPDDFDVRDFVRLPFQIGPTLCVATFRIPPENVHELRCKAVGHGTWTQLGNNATFEAAVASIECAAAWAIAEGAVPVQPKELVDAWKERLRGALEVGR